MSALLLQPLYPGCPLAVWPFILLGLAIFAAIALLLLHRRKRRKRAKPPVTQRPATTTERQPAAKSEASPPLEVNNLQGLGAREEQQDAFGLSALAGYAEKGLLLVLCDGMGGMHAGGEIARKAVADILAAFPFREEKLADWTRALTALSKDIRRSYSGRGGTTLVMCYIRKGRLWFWCAGDSDLFLVREGRLYAVNTRHEYQNELLAKAIQGEGSVEQAFADPQAGALTAYLGCESLTCTFSRKPYPLQKGDKLLLCTDGVTDTLPLLKLEKLLYHAPMDALPRMEEAILSASAPAQDNYTAILLQYNG